LYTVLILRLPDYLLADLHSEARRRNSSVSRLLEHIAEEKIVEDDFLLIWIDETTNIIRLVRLGTVQERLL